MGGPRNSELDMAVIEPFRTTVRIPQVRAAWHALTGTFPRNPAMVVRLMTLYLGDGTTYLMSPEGLYMACDFNRLSKTIGYKHSHELIKAVIQSGIFTMSKANNPYKINWFASPLYLNELELSKAMEEYKNSANTDAQDAEIDQLGDWNNLFSGAQTPGPRIGLYNRIINNSGLNNIILSGRKAKASFDEKEDDALSAPEASDSASNTSEDSLAEVAKKMTTLPPYEVRSAEYNRFVKVMYADTEFFVPLREMLTAREVDGHVRAESEVFTTEQAREILNRLMYYHLKPYFMNQLRFFKYPSLESRRAWLGNLLYGANGRKMITAAINFCRQRWKRQEQQAFTDSTRAAQQSHPLSPFEWTDPASGKRFYRESATEAVALPDDAPARPSVAAHWNKFTKEWTTPPSLPQGEVKPSG